MNSIRAMSGPRAAFAVALLNCFANGIFYIFSIFSTRLAMQLGISRPDVVILGILSQVGAGIFQYPTTLVQTYFLEQKNVSNERMDKILAVYAGFLFCSATLGIATMLYLSENGVQMSYGTVMGVLSACFLMWGAGVGTTFNGCSTVITFNTQANLTLRRIQLVSLSLAVGMGGVILVILYHYEVREKYELSTFFFGLAVFYFCCILARLCFLVRVMPNATALSPEQKGDEESSPGTSPAEIAPNERIMAQPLSVLLKSSIAWLCFVGTFLGIGVGGTYLSSIGNLGSNIAPERDLTFTLTLIFLCLQTAGRLANAIGYSLADWPYVYACWQAICLTGICSFLIAPNETGAYVSATFVGMSFGGFHSSFPVIVATTFPGIPSVDYSLNLGVAMAVGSLGCIVVGQITTAVYKAASSEDMNRSAGFSAMFIFFVVLAVISLVSSVFLGRKIRHVRRQKMKVTQDHRPDAARGTIVSTIPDPSLLAAAPSIDVISSENPLFPDEEAEIGTSASSEDE